MRRIAAMAFGVLAMIVGWSSTVRGIEPAGGGYDLLAQMNEFKATPDRIRTDQQPRLMDQMRGQVVGTPRQGLATSAYSASRDGRVWAFRVAGSVPEIRTMRWESSVAQHDAARLPYYVIRYRAKGQRRDYHRLAVIAVGGAAPKARP